MLKFVLRVNKGLRASSWILGALLLTTGFVAFDAAHQYASASTLHLTRILKRTELNKPIHAVSPKGDTQRLFILDQRTGNIRIYNTNTNTLLSDTFLTVPEATGTHGEQGLLSMAFDPDYASSGKFFVSVVDANGTHKVIEYQVSTGNPNVANAAPTRTILTIEDVPNSNPSHNGGWIEFSPKDGNLYISVGDHGQGPSSPTSQQADNKFGSILRINPFSDDFPTDADNNYSVPADNPFVGTSNDGAVWAYGLRNPWRPTFDSITGDLFIADVGEDSVEEINIGIAGANYGWPGFEGTHPLNTGLLTVPENSLEFPIYEYLHEAGRGSITGGGVYHGAIDDIENQYFFADFLSGEIWSFLWDSDLKSISSVTNWTLDYDQLGISASSIGSFGFDGNGEMYLLGIFGGVFQITDAELSVSAVPLPAALPLYGTGLAIIGIIGWRRKQRQSA